jgi:pilus assembly protein CpaE
MSLSSSSAKKLFRCIIICPEKDLADPLEVFLADFRQLGLARKLDRYPDSAELVPILRAHAPELVFLSVESLDAASNLAQAIEACTPGVQIVAVTRSSKPQLLIELMRLGIREILTLPYRVPDFEDAMYRLTAMLTKTPPRIKSTDQLFAFLPSKGGVGASTIALNTSVALSRIVDGEVLLGDFDLGTGSIQFQLNLDNRESVVEAAQHSMHMDEIRWPRLISKVDQLSILHAGPPNPNFDIDGAHIRNLLDFARRNYEVVCADLSGNMEKFSIDIALECKRIFLVCTPEIASVHLAREKCHLLKSFELGERVGVLMSPCLNPSPLSTAEIEDVLGLPVDMTLSNDPAEVNKAVTAGKAVDAASELGKQFAELAASILQKPKTMPPGFVNRVVEYFSLIPARHTLVRY